jgi:predicted porin
MKTTMKVLAASCALAAISMGAQAQPLTRLTNNVTIYGIIDSGVERVTNVGATRGSLTRVPSLTSSLPSRIGFRGAEDLGGGLWAQFVLETGIAIDTGLINQGGRYFGRQSFVGLSGAWGTVSVGRQYDPFYLATLDTGVFGPNAYGLGSLDPYIPAARFDNSIAYNGQFGNFGVGANYSLGRDVVPAAAGTVCAGENANDFHACQGYGAMVKYTDPNWGVALGYGVQRGGAGAAAGLTNSNREDSRLTLNGYYTTNVFKIGGGVIRRENDGSLTQPRSNLYWIEGAYAVTPAISAELFFGRLDFNGAPTNDANLYAIRGVYSFSKRSAVYATAGRINNHGISALSVSASSPGGTPVAGSGQTGILVGVRTTF